MEGGVGLFSEGYLRYFPSFTVVLPSPFFVVVILGTKVLDSPRIPLYYGCPEVIRKLNTTSDDKTLFQETVGSTLSWFEDFVNVRDSLCPNFIQV